MRIAADDPTRPDVAALLADYHALMRSVSPPVSVHTLGHDRLRHDDVSFWTARDGDALLAFVALRELAADHAEVKSMHVAAAHQRRGIARALLDHVVGVARTRGYRRLSLETGSGPAFAAPLALYRGYGFVDGATYGEYGDDPFLTFLHLDL